MKIVVSSQGETLDAPASPVFGRCPTYRLCGHRDDGVRGPAQPGHEPGGGAGIQAAQFVVNQGAQAVLTGNLGPNAFDVLQAAGVPGYLVPEGTVRQAVEAFKAGQLQPMGGANVAAHAGMGGGRRGMGRGMGMAGAAPPVQPRPGQPTNPNWPSCARRSRACASNWPRRWTRSKNWKRRS